jgi:hypothetical protein
MRPLAILDDSMWRGRPRPRTASNKEALAGIFRRRPLLALIVLLTALTPCAAAQRSAHAAAPAHSANPRLNAPTANFALGRSAHPAGSRRFSPYTSLPFPFFGDFFNPDDIYSTGYPVASPPVILLQAARDYSDQPGMFQPKNNRETATTTQPLMIELQNGRYVRVTSTPANGEPLSIDPGQAQPNDAKPARPTRPNSTQPAASNSITQTLALPPALLVFRDGHTEEVRDYAIADGILYARGDYYTDGYWNKKIAISTLNVPETLEANSTRKVQFTLPASPNEVIIRP